MINASFFIGILSGFKGYLVDIELLMQLRVLL
jgi:hypothetical protein